MCQGSWSNEAHARRPDPVSACACCAAQNANRRPNTYKLLLLPGVRQKAEELGVHIPDQQTLIAMAERTGALKVRGESQFAASIAQCSRVVAVV